MSHEPTFQWQPGERADFSSDWDPKALEPGGYLDTLRNGGWMPTTDHTTWDAAQWAKMSTDWESKFKQMCAPDEIAWAEVLRHHVEYAKYPMSFARAVVSRFEMRAYPVILVEANTHPKEAISAFGPFDAPALAPAVAKMFLLKKQKPIAEAWLRRHPAAARAGLAADAAGKGPTKKAALAALGFLDA